MLTRSQITAKMLDTIVADHFASEEYNEMVLSDLYYESKNSAIMARKRLVAFADDVPGELDAQGLPTFTTHITTTEDYSKANHKLPHSFHFELINQVKN